MATSGSEVRSGEVRTWALIIGIARIPSGTVLVNARYLLMNDLVLGLGEEEAGIAGMRAQGRRREGEDLLHRPMAVVDVAEAGINEAGEVMPIVHCPALLRKTGIDSGFDSAALPFVIYPSR